MTTDPNRDLSLAEVCLDSLERSRNQARLQVASQDDGTVRFRLLEPERDASGTLIPNRGLLAVPEPATGDLFFDIEGARYYSEDSREFGLQYLFGVVDTADLDEAGRPRYTPIWAFDRVRSARSRSWLTSSLCAGRCARGCTYITTTTTNRPRSTISPSCTGRARRRWAL